MGLRLLSLGAMGSGPRRIIGSGVIAPPSLTLLEWSRPSKLIRETTIDLNTMQPMASEALPAQLSVSGFPVARRRSLQWQRGSLIEDD